MFVLTHQEGERHETEQEKRKIPVRLFLLVSALVFLKPMIELYLISAHTSSEYLLLTEIKGFDLERQIF